MSNLLRYLAEVPGLDETAGQIYDVACNDILTYKDIMLRYARLVGKRPVIIPVPVLTPRLSSYWLRLVTSVPTNVARALIGGLTQDVIAEDQRLAALIPQDLLDFDAAAAEALRAERQHEVPAHWVESAVACQGFSPAYGYYAKQAQGSALTAAKPTAIWAVLCQFGHGGDFFYARGLWWLRRALDFLIGGPCFRRRRRHPAALRVGDVVDAWRVIECVPEKKLTLLMEMKAPGAGVLEFSVDELGSERRISVHAYWHPAGVWGLLYWYATLPLHALLFRGMARRVGERALDLPAAA